MRYVIVSDIHGNYDALQAVDQVDSKWRQVYGKERTWVMRHHQ